ncbi:hypothetical protein BGZ65_000706 [Modicella reniformis]|uniref:Uncharacterized protein n=1 Tax=Modicella reniformis TaxID=1440133 RepID=A0A9P6MA84_9FUNG|nr:hypothetical protein BGZ65_000706 [Modicella reniformis]
MLSFQLHHAEISTDQPSVSGRMLLYIPKLHGKKFHFVSLILVLRLKESIAWVRQDLVSFEIEKQSWSQTVWDKRIVLPFQDRQAEEGRDETFVAVVKEPSKGTKGARVEIPAHEWRWEFLIPVTEHDVRPESFEGSMGAVWYELEAKCLFRWDDVDKDGHVVEGSGDPLSQTVESVYDTTALSRNPATACTKKANSLVQAIGKLRVGTKNKKMQLAGDFKVENQHSEFVKRSLRMRNNNLAPNTTASGSGSGNDNQTDLSSPSATDQNIPPLEEAERPAEPVPFLIRKILKIYFVKPPPYITSRNAFFLPAPSMTFPMLPATRRLKAIIPGARIQVQIQIPSLIPIRGYAQTSQLIPDSKKGMLVFNKQCAQTNDQYQQYHNITGWELDSRYPDSFQVALTVRKVTQKDIDKSDTLTKRYQTLGSSSSVSPFATSALNPDVAASRNRQPSTSMSASNLSGQFKAGYEDGDNSKEANGLAPSKLTSSGGPWRKEIRVRKVRCEFWQKESCRIPSVPPEHNLRTIKHALGPVFTYSEKDQARSSLHLQSLPMQAACISNTAGNRTAGERELSLSPPLMASANLSNQASQASSPLQAPSMPHKTGRSGSDASLYASPALLPASVLSTSPAAAVPRLDISQGSKPFMLLIPVPLDSSKLRQTFAWPTSDIPTSLSSKAFDSMPQLPRTYSNEEPASDYPTTQALYQMAMVGTAAGRVAATTGARLSSDMARSSDANATDYFSDASSPTSPYPTPNRPAHYYHHQQTQQLPNGSSSLRTRIEVKHYLSIRLSIDLLEFEGELDQDEDLDLEAMEEQQLQQVRKHQELFTYGMHTFPVTTSSSPTAASPRIPSGVPASCSIGDDHQDRSKYSINAGTSTLSSVHMNSIVAAPTPMGMSTIQPALTFLNSAAGLLDMDTDLDAESGAGVRSGGRSRSNSQQRPSRRNSASGNSLLQNAPPQSLLGSAYDLNQRRGSGASQSTAKSRAICAIKKKASSTGVNAMVNAVTGGSHHGSPHAPTGTGSCQAQHRRQRSSAVTAHKLKDFVIRVPITVMIQVDDITSMGSAAKFDSGDTTTHPGGATDTVNGNRGSERAGSSDPRNGGKSMTIFNVTNNNGYIKKNENAGISNHERDEYDEYVEGQFLADQD